MLSALLQEFLYQGRCLFHADMKLIVNHDPMMVDDDGPGSPTGPIFTHGGRDAIRCRITGIVGHGHANSVLVLTFAQLFGGIVMKPLKYGLDGQKGHVRIGVETVGQRP